MRTKAFVTISIDKEVLKETKRILKELGLNTSFYINTVMRALVDSETKSMKNVYGEVYGPLFDRINKHHKKIKKEKRT